MRLVIEPLRKEHQHTTFDSGDESLNRYLKQVARRSARRTIGITHVAVLDNEPLRIIGYYTLLTANVAPDLLPDEQIKRNTVPVVLLARLAVDRSLQGQGIGTYLLLRALSQIDQAGKTMPIFALITRAKNETSAAFFIHFGFLRLTDDPLHFYLPV